VREGTVRHKLFAPAAPGLLRTERRLTEYILVCPICRIHACLVPFVDHCYIGIVCSSFAQLTNPPHLMTCDWVRPMPSALCTAHTSALLLTTSVALPTDAAVSTRVGSIATMSPSCITTTQLASVPVSTH
jgi:hypothetical protein